MKYSTKQKRLITLELTYSCLMILVGAILPIVLLKNHSITNQTAVYGLELLAAAGLSVQLFIYLSGSKAGTLRIFFVASLIIAPLLSAAAIG